MLFDQSRELRRGSEIQCRGVEVKILCDHSLPGPSRGMSVPRTRCGFGGREQRIDSQDFHRLTRLGCDQFLWSGRCRERTVVLGRDKNQCGPNVDLDLFDEPVLGRVLRRKVPGQDKR